MRVSEYCRLGRKQPTLDFVDVDTTGDVRVFIDPRAREAAAQRLGRRVPAHAYWVCPIRL